MDIPWVLTSLGKWQCRGDRTLAWPARGKLVVQALPLPRIPCPLKKGKKKYPSPYPVPLASSPPTH